MQPMGHRPVRFPSKKDHHLPKGVLNWWESEICTVSKKRERASGKKQIALALNE